MPTQCKLPGMEPGRQANTLPAPSEKQQQRAIEEGLTRLGYTVLSTVHQYNFQTCPCCGHRFRPVGGYGVKRGIPDLLVSRDGWPPVFMGLEIKGATTPISTQQRELARCGRIRIVRGWEAARAEVEAVTRFMADKTAIRVSPDTRKD